MIQGVITLNKNFQQALIVGVFTLSSVIAAVFFMHYVRKGISGGAYKVWALLHDADGLYKKSRVMIAGIVIGEIVDIGLQEGKARIDLRIRKDVTLYKDASIAKVSLGLLGDQGIVLTPGIQKKSVLTDGGQIKNIQKIGLMETLSNTVPKINEAIPGIVKLTKALGDLSEGPASQGRGSLRDIAESLRSLAMALSKSIQQNQERVNTILRSVERISVVMARTSQANAKQISGIISDVKDITTNARRLSGEEKTLRETLRYVRDITKSVRDLAKDASPSSKVAQQALQNLERALHQLNQIAGTINKGQGTIGRLIKDDTIVKQVEGAVTNITNLVNRISLMRTHVRWRADYFFSRGRFRNEFQVTLAPSPNKYYTIALVDDPRGVTSISRRVTRTTDPTRPPLINEEITTIADSFRFSLQLNFRWWLFNFRGGIIESTAGFGIDLFPYKDYIKIRTEIFDFTNENLPRLRILASFNYLYFNIAVGVDDVLNDGTRDFFVGAGLRFTDEDLKAILPFIPTR